MWFITGFITAVRQSLSHPASTVMFYVLTRDVETNLKPVLVDGNGMSDGHAAM